MNLHFESTTFYGGVYRVSMSTNLVICWRCQADSLGMPMAYILAELEIGISVFFCQYIPLPV